MTLQPIPIGDTTTETGSDFDRLSDMSSPTISNFSSVLASPDECAQPGLLSNIDLNGFADDSIKVEILPPLKLTSFFPIIENLPGLVLEDNTYHVDGPILAADLDDFVAYSHRVEDLLLTDLPAEPSSKVSISTIDRLIRIDNPESPFLSSLKRLRLADADCSLRYLVFCATPSLESLEVTGIPQHHQITVSDFLKDLPHYAPRLAAIALGPGPLSFGALRASLKFTHLKHLSVIDAALSFDFSFLWEISALPELQSLIIEARSLKYGQRSSYGFGLAHTRSASSLTEHVRRRLDFPQADRGLDGTDGTSPPSLTNSTPIPFPSLSKLAIVSDILLMGDLVYYLFPRGVRELALTLVRAGLLAIPRDWEWGCDSYRQDPVLVPVASVKGGKVKKNGKGRILSTHNQETETKIPVSVCSNPRRTRKQDSGPAVFSDYEACQTCSGCYKHSEELTQERSEAQAKQEALAIKYAEEKRQRELENLGVQTCCFASMVEVFLEFGKPAVISIANFDTVVLSASDTSTKAFGFPEFPSSTLSKMLLYPTLSELEIKDWTLSSVDSSFIDSSSVSTTTSPLQSLYLPIGSKASTGITLPTLRAIAHRYPNLLKLQCHILPSAEPFSFTIEEATVKHRLQVLSIGGGPPSSSEEKLAIATYLWFLFPSLKQIATRSGNDEEDWDHIHKLVKMCQVVRAAD